ncbi:outer membrane beta-barrel protein [Pontibacter mangrovi]|uniref:TonB-dependent receptor n=1 Tax=Pontibacter mangrovi TaxID=2589816 RepID=A0A501VXF2_9BACT|nr:outer membrane beta-barrel protein [Pontibacter mangrovi]TPE42403.1 TonB-dependent receptor [Pontibacter mangrovi]
MKLLFATGLCCLLACRAFAQLTGSLQDQGGNALSYASVNLLQLPDSTGVSGTLTAQDGSFSIPPPASGTYTLRVSMVGYGIQHTGSFTVGSGAFCKDFGTLTLQAHAHALQEVSVTALQAAMTLEADKLVVRVAQTPLAAGGTAYEVLGKVPGVLVDPNGNIQLHGRTGVDVLLDGRRTYLSGKELQHLLEAVSAENVQTIEVMANPSARYDAAGSAGLINITLKQNTQRGMSGSLHAGYQYNGASGYNSGLNLNYKKGRWSSFLAADMARRPRLREGVMVREFHAGGADATFRQGRDETLTMLSPALRLGTERELTPHHRLGTVLHLGRNSMDRAFYSGTDLQDRKRGTHTFIEAGNFNDNRQQNASVNLYYEGRLDTAGSTLSASLDYVQLDNEARALYDNLRHNRESGTSLRELLRSDNPGSYHIYAAKADYSQPLSPKATLEAGVKASHVVSGNALRFYVVEEGREVRDTRRSNDYRYTERILAGYVSFRAALGKAWNLQAGLRAEGTAGKGQTQGRQPLSRRKYTDLFPTFSLSQQVSENYRISYSYNRRIDRPNYRSLNPFIFYQDPYSWAEGNPDLRPQYTSSFQVAQTLHQSYHVLLGYSRTRDFFAEVPEQRAADNTTVYQERNVDMAEHYSATFLVPVRVAAGWEVSHHLEAGYGRNRMLLQDRLLENRQFFGSLQAVHQVLLPGGLQLQATAAYQSPSTYGMYTFRQQWWLDAGLEKSLLRDKLDLSLGATDIFRTRKMRGDASYNGDGFRFENYFMARSLKLQLRYSFQRGQGFKAQSPRHKLEELNRAGGQ